MSSFSVLLTGLDSADLNWPHRDLLGLLVYNGLGWNVWGLSPCGFSSPNRVAQACLHVDGREQQEEVLQGVLSPRLRTDPLSHLPLPSIKANHKL